MVSRTHSIQAPLLGIQICFEESWQAAPYQTIFRYLNLGYLTFILLALKRVDLKVVYREFSFRYIVQESKQHVLTVGGNQQLFLLFGPETN